MYSEKIMETFLNSENVGDLKGATVNATVKSKKYGDIIKIYLKIGATLNIEDAKYKAFGGILTSVCASKMCDIIKGKTLIAAQRITSEEILKEVGRVPEEQQYLASLATLALFEAIKKYLKRVKRLSAKNMQSTEEVKQ